MVYANKEKTMTNKKNWLGMLALALVFGMTVVGCSDGSTNDGDEEKAVPLPSTAGEFIFTDIPSKYNGKFVLLEGYFSSNSSRMMIGYKGATINTSNPNYYSTLTCVKIENGSVKIPLYTFSSTSSPVSTIQAYSGNDAMYVDILVYNTEIISASNINYYVATAVFGTTSDTAPTTFPVQFSDGKVSKSNNDATEKLE
jgi:hypothetical protein